MSTERQESAQEPMIQPVPAEENAPYVDQPYTAAEYRKDIADGIKAFGTHVSKSLYEAHTDSLLVYVLAISLAPILRMRNQGTHSIDQLLRLIWPDRYSIFEYHLDSGQLSLGNLAHKIHNLLDTDTSSAPLFESLLIFSEAIIVLEEQFVTREWVLDGLRTEISIRQRAGQFQRLQIRLRSEELQAPKTSRGDLQVQVSTSKPTIVAGEEFSVFVVVTNPFDVPIVLYSVESQIPVEIVDVVERQRRRSQILKELAQVAPSKLRQQLESFLSLVSPLRLLDEVASLAVRQWEIYIRMASEPESRIAQAVSSSEVLAKSLPDIPYRQEWQIERNQGQITGVSVDQRVDFHIDSASLQHLDRILWRLELFKRGVIPIVLQPGDAIVKQFIFKTKRWLLFTPLAHTMQIQVRYASDERDHLDTVPFNLTIQSSIIAIMVGAVAGGIVGGVARLFTDVQSGSTLKPSTELLGLNWVTVLGAITIAQLLSLLMAVILSAMTIVAFARKSGVQQIVTIEDFWGGLFLGFLIGFFGQNYALNLIAPNSGTPKVGP